MKNGAGVNVNIKYDEGFMASSVGHLGIVLF